MQSGNETNDLPKSGPAASWTGTAASVSCFYQLFYNWRYGICTLNHVILQSCVTVGNELMVFM